MKLTDIKAVAADRGVKPGRMNKTDLIRAIQAAEGNPPCFGTGQVEHCGQHVCLWREDCQ